MERPRIRVLQSAKSGTESVCQKSVVVSPVEILIFVWEAFYPGKDRTQGPSHWWHELVSICRPQGRGREEAVIILIAKIEHQPHAGWDSFKLLLQSLILSQKQ